MPYTLSTIKARGTEQYNTVGAKIPVVSYKFFLTIKNINTWIFFTLSYISVLVNNIQKGMVAPPLSMTPSQPREAWRSPGFSG
jgi:hypothetical protein